MQAEEIIHYLELLGEELEALQFQQPVRLLMVGGAYMITQIGNRTVTMDVDVVTHIDPYTQEYQSFKNAVRFVAGDEHIEVTWLSDNIGDFIFETRSIPTRHLWLKHGMLEVYVPDPEHILVLKMIAWRDKDIEDVEALLQRLRIRSRKRAEKVLKKYGDVRLLEDYAEEVEKALAFFFG